jgi:GINS complex subunit 1
MNYGNHGRDLLLELSRSSAAGSSSASEPALTAYNDETVRNCLQDLKLHVQALQDQVEANSNTQNNSQSGGSGGKPSVAVRPSILLQNAAIQRNKRCLLAYHAERCNRIKDHLYWQQKEQETVQVANSGSTRQVLCPAEQEWLVGYAAAVDKYTASTGLSMDALRANLMPPAAADRCTVRVVDDTPFDDAICLESGATAVFEKGTTHYLLAADVEEYVRAGYLELLDGEEQGM